MALQPLGSVRAKNQAKQQKQSLTQNNVMSNAKTASQPLPQLNTSTATPQKSQSFLGQAKTGAEYIKQNVSQPDARNMATDITNIRNQQNLTATPEKPLASNTTDQAALLKGRDQNIPQPKPAQPVETPETPTTPEQVQNQATQAANTSNQYTDQLDALQKAKLDGEDEYRDAVIQGANERYNAEQQNLNNLQGLQDKTLADRNAALQAGSEIERKDAEIAYNDAKAAEELQRERAQKAYEDQIVEQKLQNTKRLLQKESMIAALGGFGSLAKNKELEETTLQNDRLLNSLVFERVASDRESTNRLQSLSSTYQNSLSRIEQDKQSSIQENYDKYMEYVTKIANDREMSIIERQDAIKKAQAEYKKNVAQVNQESFEQRYEISERMAAQAREIQEKDKTDAREVMNDILGAYAMSGDELSESQKKQLADLEKRAGYPSGSVTAKLQALKEEAKAKNLQIEQILDDEGNVTYVSVDKATGQIVNYETLEGVGKAAQDKYQLSYDPIWGTATVFNSRTGQYEKVSNTQGFSTMGGQQAPAGTQVMGGNIVDNKEFNKAFKVGQNVGLWCGVYATSISTARRVGNTWNEKLNAIDKRDNPKPGDKLLVPLGVKSDGSGWGHVAVVTNYDPATGNITVVESNKDGKKRTDNDGYGTVTTGVYNLNKLKQSYGANFGFASGDFKPEIKKQLEQGILPNSQNIASQMGGGANQDFYQEGLSLGLSPKLAQEYALDKAKKMNQSADPKDALDLQLKQLQIQKTQQELKGGGFNKDIFQAEGALRDDFTKNTQTFTKVRDAYNTIKTAAAKPNAANDLSLIFAYMKMLDPNSTVREGEFANAQNAAGVPAQIQNQWNKLQSGERLNDDQRQQFLGSAEDLYKVSKQGYDQQISEYRNLAEGYGLDPNKSIINYDIPQSNSDNNWLAKLLTGSSKSPSYQAVGADILEPVDYDFYNSL